MRNQAIPTHYALTMSDIAKVTQSAKYAKAVLTLIQHNGSDDDSLAFFSSDDVIRTALQVVDHFLDDVQQAANRGFYGDFEKQGGVQ